MVTDQKKLERKLEALRNTPNKGATGRKKVDLLNDLAHTFIFSEPERTEDYARQAVALAEKLDYRKGICCSHRHIGDAYSVRNDFNKAKQHYYTALRIWDRIRDKKCAADIFNSIGLLHQAKGDYSQMLKYHNKALKFAQEAGIKDTVATCYGNIGYAHKLLGDYGQALEYYHESLRIFKQIRDEGAVARVHNNIGECLYSQGDYVQASKYYLSASRIFNKGNEKMGMAISALNIGRIYERQGNYNKALLYYNKALKLYEEHGNKMGFVASSGSIADIYYRQGEYKRALKYYFECLSISKEIKDKPNVATSYEHIGAAYQKLGNLRKGLEYCLKSLAIFTEINEKYAIADTQLVCANLYRGLKRYNKANEYIQKGLRIAKKIKARRIEAESYESLSLLFEVQHDYKKALTYYRKYVDLKEQVFGVEKSRQITDMTIKYETEKKENEAKIYRLKNVDLRREIRQRRKIERQLQEHRDHLEDLVTERTSRLEREIGERKLVEKRLIGNQKQLRQLAREVSLIEERQRRKFATFLHDDINQALALATFKLRSIQASNPGKNNRTELDEIKTIIDKTAERTRQLAFEISPPILYELGLESALEWLTRQFGEQYGVKNMFEDDGTMKPLTDEARVFLFQSVREILANVAKHAQAKNIKVCTHKDNNSLCITVEDDGIGFNPATMDKKIARNESFGLFNIRERLRHIQGTLEIHSNKGKGAKVVINAPLMRKRGRKKKR